MRISVALTIYNGEKYMREQIDSILKQLRPEDELIISFNPSTDNSLAILKEVREQNSNVKVVLCREIGLNANKSNSILHCNGDIIMLADQDDVWEDDKVEKVCKAFEDPDVILVLHNCVYTDAELNNLGKELFFDRNAKKGFFKNLTRNCYQGSCMAFRADLKPLILPIPRDIMMHDQWIGLLAQKVGKVAFVEKPLMLYRRHDETTSETNVPFTKKLSDMFRVNHHLIARMEEDLTHVNYLRNKYKR